MATIVNNPPATTDSNGNGVGLIIGLIFLALIVILFLVYGLPLMGRYAGGGNPQINVPGKMDVNVKQTK